jgi:hypothetical protein
MDVSLPTGPPFFRFSDSEESKRTLTAAGFSDVRVQQIPQLWRLESGEDLFQSFRTAAVRTAALLNLQSTSALEKIREEIVGKAETFRKGDFIELPMPSVLTYAVKR